MGILWQQRITKYFYIMSKTNKSDDVNMQPSIPSDWTTVDVGREYGSWGPLGNAARLRHAMITIPHIMVSKVIRELNSEGEVGFLALHDITYLRLQEEHGLKQPDGHTHLQGFLSFGKQKSVNQIRQMFTLTNEKFFIDKPNNIKACKQYCFKSDTRIPDGFQITWGEFETPAEKRKKSILKRSWDEAHKDAGSDGDDNESDEHDTVKMLKTAARLIDGETRGSIILNDVSMIMSARWWSEVKSLQSCVEEQRAIERGMEKSKQWYDQLGAWQHDVIKVLKESADDDRTIHVLVDEEGGTGKSILKEALPSQFKAYVIASGKANDIKHLAAQYPGTSGPELLILDVSRDGMQFTQWHAIEEIKSGSFQSTKYAGKNVQWAKPPQFLVLSNQNPDMQKLSMDRWKIGKLQKGPGSTPGEMAKNSTYKWLNKKEMDLINLRQKYERQLADEKRLTRFEKNADGLMVAMPPDSSLIESIETKNKIKQLEFEILHGQRFDLEPGTDSIVKQSNVVDSMKREMARQSGFQDLINKLEQSSGSSKGRKTNKEKANAAAAKAVKLMLKEMYPPANQKSTVTKPRDDDTPKLTFTPVHSTEDYTVTPAHTCALSKLYDAMVEMYGIDEAPGLWERYHDKSTKEVERETDRLLECIEMEKKTLEVTDEEMAEIEIPVTPPNTPAIETADQVDGRDKLLNKVKELLLELHDVDYTKELEMADHILNLNTKELKAEIQILENRIQARAEHYRRMMDEDID